MSNYQELLPIEIMINNTDKGDGQSDNDVEYIIIRDVHGDPDEHAFHISTGTGFSKLITKEHSDPGKYNKILAEWLKVNN